MRVSANGISVNFECEDGTSPVVTFSHALGATLAIWDAQIAGLRDYRTLRYDLRGHGGTKATPSPYTMRQLAEDVYRLLQALDVDRTHYVGISLGGMIGQHLALAHPEVLRSLTLCDTSARVLPEGRALWDERIALARAQGMDAHAEGTVGRWFTPSFIGDHPEVVDPIREIIRRTDVEGFVGCARALQGMDVLDHLQEIRVPTLIIVGEQDPGSPVAAARTIHKRIPGSEMVVLKSASHLSNVEQPEAFNDALLSFLRRVDPL
jgi:3-oxoadipate enol-lactonase